MCRTSLLKEGDYDYALMDTITTKYIIMEILCTGVAYVLELMGTSFL